jgi:hypothetical protein
MFAASYSAVKGCATETLRVNSPPQTLTQLPQFVDGFQPNLGFCAEKAF